VARRSATPWFSLGLLCGIRIVIIFKATEFRTSLSPSAVCLWM
jgi:hypothetical protein